MKVHILTILLICLVIIANVQAQASCPIQCQCDNNNVCNQCVNAAVNQRQDIVATSCPCLNGYYDNGEVKCLQCAAKCNTCQAFNNCLLCTTVANNNRQNLANFCECNVGFYDAGEAACKQCNARCSACTSDTVCTACNGTNRNPSKICVCQDRYFDNAVANCVQCNHTCGTCTAAAACVTCGPNWKKNGNEQLCSLCNDGYYNDGLNNFDSCKICPSQCATCVLQVGNIVCQSCKTGRTLQTGVAAGSTGAQYCPCTANFQDASGTQAICTEIFFKQDQLNQGKKSSITSTVTVDGKSDIGTCICNFITGQCEALCCCDPDCSNSAALVKQWRDSNVCISEDINEVCIKKVDLFRFNERRGILKKTRGNEICVQNDDKTEYTKFQDQSSDIPSKVLTKKYNSLNSQIFPSQSSYSTYSDNIAVESNQLARKLYIQYPNSFGNCEQIKPVLFKKNVPLQQCYLKNIRPTQTNACTTTLSYTQYINFQIYGSKSRTSGLTPQVRYVYTRAADGKVSEGTAVTNSNQNAANCICQNAFQGATYYITYSGSAITGINVAIWVGDINKQANCAAIQANQNLDQQDVSLFFEVKWIEQVQGIADIQTAGFPGYLVGLNIPSGINNGGILQERNGLFLRGREYQTGRCIVNQQLSDYSYDPLTMPVVQFGQDLVLSCYHEIQPQQFQATCAQTLFNQLMIFQNLLLEKPFLGQFGNANLNYIKDWIEVQIGNQPTISYNATSGECSFPNEMILSIFYKKVGFVLNLQNIIVDAQIVYKQNTKFKTNSSNKYWFSLKVQFLDVLEDEIENQQPGDPTIIPQFPTDIFFPVWYEGGTVIVANLVLLLSFYIVMLL